MNHNPDLAITPEIAEFLDSCLWDKGIRDIPAEMKAEMIRNLAARLQPWLLHSAAEKLSDSDILAMDKLLEEQQNAQTIQEFLRKRIKNIDEVFGEAMIKFKEAYVQS